MQIKTNKIHIYIYILYYPIAWRAHLGLGVSELRWPARPLHRVGSFCLRAAQCALNPSWDILTTDYNIWFLDVWSFHDNQYIRYLQHVQHIPYIQYI